MVSKSLNVYTTEEYLVGFRLIVNAIYHQANVQMIKDDSGMQSYIHHAHHIASLDRITQNDYSINYGYYAERIEQYTRNFVALFSSESPLYTWAANTSEQDRFNSGKVIAHFIQDTIQILQRSPIKTDTGTLDEIMRVVSTSQPLDAILTQLKTEVFDNLVHKYEFKQKYIIPPSSGEAMANM